MPEPEIGSTTIQVSVALSPLHSLRGEWAQLRGRLAGQILASMIVAITAIVLRVPSCSESFWVDELHTAWTIHDGLTEIVPRSQIGHQQPYYFALLWLWRQAFGESELVLRMTSVLAVTAASVLLTVAVARSTRSTLAGFAAGMFLALESNSIFFGTELRPYATVILASAACCYFSQQSWNAKPTDRGVSWLLLFVSLGAAATMQLTSLGILAWLPIAIVARWCWFDWRGVVRPKRIDAAAMLAVVATALMTMPKHVLETWNSRSIWASFASTRYIDDLWELWPWLAGLILPAVWFIFNHIVDLAKHTDRVTTNQNKSFTLTLTAILIGSTCLLWLVSYNELAPLWHRRFMIAGLPILAWCFGALVGSGAGQGRAGRSFLNAAAAITLLVMLTSWSQSTLPKLLRSRWQLAARGEDWRTAVAYLNSKAKTNDAVVIDSGLIEQVAWHKEIVSAPLLRERSEYLSYPLRGPYQLKHVASVVASNLLPVNDWATSHDQSWIISRRRSDRLNQAIQKLVDTKTTTISVRSFGGVSVARVKTKAR